jgi:hypothetical protein
VDREINFKPITDGLGFHPFEDGLPYAPAVKKQIGTGAVSAGRPQFSYPPAPPSPMGKPVDATAEKIRRELESIQTQRIEQARAMAERLHSPLEIHRGISYSFQRAFAYLLDSAFNLSICASILSTALISSDLTNLRSITDPALITVGVFLFICNWALLAAQEVAFGTSIGKRIFGLSLEGTGVECLVRSLLFIPSLLLAGTGILSALFDSKKRCWHDRVTLIQPT